MVTRSNTAAPAAAAQSPASRPRGVFSGALDRKRVVVAVSGGVDSSFAASLLAGDYDVTALHFTKFTLPGLAEEVRARDEKSLASARAAAGHLGIDLEVVEVGERFVELVDFFCGEYHAGRTPNPCVLCNATIKWPVLLEAADRRGAYYVATGHYAAVRDDDGLRCLVRPRDKRKDQTYFLHRLTQRQLARTIFPLAERTKAEVRESAREAGLRTVERAESQEICFVPSGGYREVLETHGGGRLRAGPVLDTSGAKIGEHEGFQLYTIGQRRGLGLALGRPAYVVNIDPRTAAVTLGDKGDLASGGLIAREVHWIAGAPPARRFRALVKIRYNHPGAEATVLAEGDAAKVNFDKPVSAVTPGQAAVLYRGDEVLGGGWIARTGRR